MLYGVLGQFFTRRVSQKSSPVFSQDERRHAMSHATPFNSEVFLNEVAALVQYIPVIQAVLSCTVSDKSLIHTQDQRNFKTKLDAARATRARLLDEAEKNQMNQNELVKQLQAINI